MICAICHKESDQMGQGAYSKWCINCRTKAAKRLAEIKPIARKIQQAIAKSLFIAPFIALLSIWGFLSKLLGPGV